MTDRVNGCHVAFEDETRIDNVEPLLSAIRQLRGVLKVEVFPVGSTTDWVAMERAKHELMRKIYDVFREKK